MGRYSSVQAYTDQQNTRTTAYEQEKGSGAGVKTEKVHNPYGSTAGAGSGEFHVYRHARNREQERLKVLDEKEIEETQEHEYQDKIQSWKSEEEKNLNKKRKKRARAKSSKMRKKNLSLSGVRDSKEDNRGEDDAVDDEFEYTPLNQMQEDEKKDGGDAKNNDVEKDIANLSDTNQVDKGASISAAPPFKNDGSFLEMMKKKMQEEAGKINSGKSAETSKVAEQQI